MLGVALYERFDESGFADTGGSDNGDNDGRGLLRESIRLQKGQYAEAQFELRWRNEPLAHEAAFL